MIRSMKPKQVPAHLKDALAGKIKGSAKKGRLIPYRELSAFATREYPEAFPKDDRRRLINCLDAVNLDPGCRGVLLSVIVVNDDGMPDSGFFRKVRAGMWPAGRLSSHDIGHETDEKIFRREASEVFRVCGAPVGFHVFIDLQNIPKRGMKAALQWLRQRGEVSGHAFSSSGQSYKRWEPFMGTTIKKHSVSNSGENAVDAALLVEFRRAAFRVPDRDIVCIMGTDAIYNQAAELAVGEGIKVLRFCGGGALEWNPESGEGFYCALNFDGGPEDWDEAVKAAQLKYRQEWDFAPRGK